MAMKKNMIVKLTKTVEPTEPYNVRQFTSLEFNRPVVDDAQQTDLATEHMLEVIRSQLRDAHDFEQVRKMMYGPLSAGGTKDFSISADTQVTVSVRFHRSQV